jgi:pre-mRNA-splicing factor 18
LRFFKEKRQIAGKRKTAEHHQTAEYLRPLLKRLKKKTLTKDLLDPISRIVKNCKDREYVLANDAYFEMAIGNAAWPIGDFFFVTLAFGLMKLTVVLFTGVTMVGIHERSAREKIFSNQVAHVLNDEVQRKYIQSLKRLMTYSQDKYPNDPSKCVR